MYVCEIELEDIVPKIWRRFQFHPEVTFHQLHNIIQVVMGWENYHLYEFGITGQAIGLPDPTFADLEDREVLNARRESVQTHLKQVGTSFTYLYDFGDHWQHKITLTQIDSSAGDPTPICLAGARSAPQEDVGGVNGHQRMIEALLTPEHPEREEFLEWLKDGYDPEHFDSEAVNVLLRDQNQKLIPKFLVRPPEFKKPVKLTKSALNKYMKQMDKDLLMEILRQCYAVSKDMEKFLAVKILGEEAAESLFHEYRKKVEHEFFPERGHGKLRLQEAKKSITEYESLTEHSKYSFELKLIYVEMGVSFTRVYGDIDARFYNSMLSMYAEVIRTVNMDDTASLYEEYEDRLYAIVSETDGIGWGFHDLMEEMYAELRWL